MFGLNSHGATPLKSISINNNPDQPGFQEFVGPSPIKYINCETGIGTLDTSYSSLITTEQTFQQSTTTGGGDPTYNIQVFGNIYFEEPINNNNVINGYALSVGDYLYIDPAETHRFKNLQGTEIERVQITAVDNVNNRVQYFAYDYDFTGINTNGDGLVSSGLGGVKLFLQQVEAPIATPTAWSIRGLLGNKATSLTQSLGLAQGTPVTDTHSFRQRDTYTTSTETILKLRFEQSATGYNDSAEMILTIPAGTTAAVYNEDAYGPGRLEIRSGTITAGGKGIIQQTSAWPANGPADYSWYLISILRA